MKKFLDVPMWLWFTVLIPFSISIWSLIHGGNW